MAETASPMRSSTTVAAIQPVIIAEMRRGHDAHESDPQQEARRRLEWLLRDPRDAEREQRREQCGLERGQEDEGGDAHWASGDVGRPVDDAGA